METTHRFSIDYLFSSIGSKWKSGWADNYRFMQKRNLFAYFKWDQHGEDWNSYNYPDYESFGDYYNAIRLEFIKSDGMPIEVYNVLSSAFGHTAKQDY